MPKIFELIPFLYQRLYRYVISDTLIRDKKNWQSAKAEVIQLNVTVLGRNHKDVPEVPLLIQWWSTTCLKELPMTSEQDETIWTNTIYSLFQIAPWFPILTKAHPGCFCPCTPSLQIDIGSQEQFRFVPSHFWLISWKRGYLQITNKRIFKSKIVIAAMAPVNACQGCGFTKEASEIYNCQELWHGTLSQQNACKEVAPITIIRIQICSIRPSRLEDTESFWN